MFEDSEVHEPFEVFWHRAIGLVTVLEHAEDRTQVGLSGGFVCGEGLDFPVDVAERFRYARLLGFEELERDRVCVVSLKELMTFSFELVLPLSEGLAADERVVAGLAKVFQNCYFDAFALGGRE